MPLTVAELTPVAGSQDAAALVVEALTDLKQYARTQTIALKTAHNVQLAQIRQQAAADLEALKAGHAKALAELSAKHAAEADELRRQLAAARREAAEVQTLRQTLYSVRHFSEQLAAAVKAP